MFCTKCGKKLPENSNFCQYCGNPVKKEPLSLLERARKQDQDALAEIYEQSSLAVYKVIKILIKDEDTVYDILQDTYVKAFTRLDQLQDERKLIPWLKVIANNTARDWLKKRKPVLFTDMSADDESDDFSFAESIEDTRTTLNPEIAMDKKEARRLLLEILDQLPEVQRLVIGMFYYEEMSVRDISTVLGISENTVKSRLVYGRKKIKELVLDLEKKGTKLYTTAPIVFFVSLLYSFNKSTSVEAAELDALHSTLQNCLRRSAQYSMYKNTGNASGSVPKQPAAIAEKAAKTAAGTAVKHAGLKAAAIILAGVVGGGGVTYGIIKNADNIPVIKDLLADTSDKTTDKNPKPSEIPAAEEKEPTETPVPTETPEPEDPESAPADLAEEANTADEPDYSGYPEYPLYKETFENFASNLIFVGLNSSTVEIALYYIDQDGTNELLISHGTCEADWKVDVYTLSNGSDVTMIGTISSHVSLYAAPDGNGIYAAFAKMGYEQITRITKNGYALEQNVVESHDIAPDAEYTEYDNPIKLHNIAETCYDAEKEKALDLLSGTWYTVGGMPYHLRAEFSGDDMKAYLPDSADVYFDRTVAIIFKTDYGYFFAINMGDGEYGEPYGYRWEQESPETLYLIDKANPFVPSISMTDSLCRDNGKLSN